MAVSKTLMLIIIIESIIEVLSKVNNVKSKIFKLLSNTICI